MLKSLSNSALLWGMLKTISSTSGRELKHFNQEFSYVNRFYNGLKHPLLLDNSKQILTTRDAVKFVRVTWIYKEAGLRVHCMTCDGTKTDISMFQGLGCSFFGTYDTMKTTFKHPTEQYDVSVILDPCHMLKSHDPCQLPGRPFLLHGSWWYKDWVEVFQTPSWFARKSRIETCKQVGIKSSKLPEN